MLRDLGFRPKMKAAEASKRDKNAITLIQQAAIAAVPVQPAVLGPDAQAQAAFVPPLALANAHLPGQGDG